MNREETKARRKTVDRARRFLTALEGTYKADQPFDVIHHPRAFNKPLECQMGKHDLVTKVVMGIPFYYCKKCGWGNPKGITDHTETRHEIRTRHVKFREPEKSVDEHVEEVFRRINYNDRK